MSSYASGWGGATPGGFTGDLNKGAQQAQPTSSGGLTAQRQQMLYSLLGQGGYNRAMVRNMPGGGGAPPGYPQVSPNMYAPGLTALASGAGWPRLGPAQPSWAAAYYGAQHPAAAPQAGLPPTPFKQMIPQSMAPSPNPHTFFQGRPNPPQGYGANAPGLVPRPAQPQSAGGHAVWNGVAWVDPLGGGVYT